MILMAGLIHLPVKLIAAFGAGMIGLHNLLDRFHVEGWNGPGTPVPGIGTKLWIILHQAFRAFPIAGFPSPIVFLVYPLIPWVGVMAAGYAFGAIYEWEAARRRRFLLVVGGGASMLFIIVRAINLYGDPSHWSRQRSFVFTVLSFLNTTKYPPSLLFLLMTLGPALLALAVFESTRAASPPAEGFGLNSVVRGLRHAFVTFGRVPLFFYILQWYTAHLIAIVAGLIAGQSVGWQFASPIVRFTSPPPTGVGFRLWVVYLCWIAGVLILYPVCKWFAGVKARRRDWWLSYL